MRSPPDIDWARGALSAALSRSKHRRIGDYELLDKLGEGATGAVYVARQRSLKRMVALKLMNARRASVDEVQRFRVGAYAAAALDHPNIAAIHEIGEHDGVPFFTMRLLEGGTLAEASERRRRSPAAAVSLMAKVARAVHHAHERGVLHRDLKPANIVLANVTPDEADEPVIVDFGFAKRLDERVRAQTPSILVGAFGYMSPEQAGGARALTFGSDIFALGVILYELLTGELPFDGSSLSEQIGRLTSSERARDPRELEPLVDDDLAYICLKCLEKDPDQRYPSAARLAHDLECWLNNERIVREADSRWARAARWCRAHPALATLLAGALCVLAATANVAAAVMRDNERAALHEILYANSDTAEDKAELVLARLRDLSGPLARCAADTRVRELFADSERETRADRILVECGATTTFESLTVLDHEGSERARLPRRARNVRPEQFARRDSFLGAKRLAEKGYRSIYVGRVLRSAGESSARRLSLSAPVFAADNRWLGAVSATVELSSILESLQLSNKGRRMAVLAGAQEAAFDEPLASDQPSEMLLMSGELEDKTTATQDWPWVRKTLQLNDAPGRDALSVSDASPPLQDPEAHAVTNFGDRWLAAYAPVGHTGYSVVVQTRYEDARETLGRAILKLVGWSLASVTLGTSAVLLLAWTLNRRARRRRTLSSAE